MSIGTLYYSHQTNRGYADFKSIPFYDASISWEREKASAMTFKSTVELAEADRIRYKATNTDFGGQVYKIKHKPGGDYEYEVIDYTRLFHDKVTVSYSNKTSSQILKAILKKNLNNHRTSGIEETKMIHRFLKWENTSIWDIALQLQWLEMKGDNRVYVDVDANGTLIFKNEHRKKKGYSFNMAHDYNEEYDASDIVTQYRYMTADGNIYTEASASESAIAKWGYIADAETCQAPSASSDKSKKKCSKNPQTSYYSKCGLSPDRKSLMAIGKPSAPGETKYGIRWWKTTFQNKCPHCGHAALIWGQGWGSGTVPCKGTSEGGSKEGHIFCTHCDADYGCITGREHIKGSRKYVKQLTKPVKSSKKEVNLLKAGKMVYSAEKECVDETSLKNDAMIKKYSIPREIWELALKICNPPAKTQKANLKKLYLWCHQHVKWVDYANTHKGALKTLRQRKGNCCDNAHLMIALARSIGIRSRYCHATSSCGHVYGEYKVDGNWFVCDTGCTAGRWGSHWNGAGPTRKRYETLPF